MRPRRSPPLRRLGRFLFLADKHVRASDGGRLVLRCVLRCAGACAAPARFAARAFQALVRSLRATIRETVARGVTHHTPPARLDMSRFAARPGGQCPPLHAPVNHGRSRRFGRGSAARRANRRQIAREAPAVARTQKRRRRFLRSCRRFERDRVPSLSASLAALPRPCCERHRAATRFLDCAA